MCETHIDYGKHNAMISEFTTKLRNAFSQRRLQFKKRSRIKFDLLKYHGDCPPSEAVLRMKKVTGSGELPLEPIP